MTCCGWTTEDPEALRGCTLGAHVWQQSAEELQLEHQLRQQDGDGWFRLEPCRGVTEASSSESEVPTEFRAVYGIDCEMCYTVEGLELARLTVVDQRLEPVLDECIRPSAPVVDYLTAFSGMNEALLQSHARLTLSELHERLRDLLGGSLPVVLVGHSLESDLLALRMAHRWLVDTSVLYPHPRGLPFRYGLKELAATHLQWIIQNRADSAGHDSLEDATAALELFLTRVADRRRWYPANGGQLLSEPVSESKRARLSTAATAEGSGISGTGSESSSSSSSSSSGSSSGSSSSEGGSGSESESESSSGSESSAGSSSSSESSAESRNGEE
jgi:RNA exonuclease 1